MKNTFQNALELAQDSTSQRKTTKKMYLYQWRIFVDWAESKGLCSLPPDLFTIGAYLRHMADLGKGAGTLRSHFAAISWFIEAFLLLPADVRPEEHKNFSYNDSPIPQAKRTLKGIISDMEQTEPHRAKAFTPDDLRRIFANDAKPRTHNMKEGSRTESDEHARKRIRTNKGLFLTMFFALLRSQEACDLQWRDLTVLDDGWGQLHIRKNKISGKRRTKNRQISPECAEALLAIRPDEYEEKDFIFSVGDGATPLCRHSITKRLKAACKHAGFPDWNEYTSHSFRVSGAMWLSSQNASAQQIADAGDWANLETVLSYVRGNGDSAVRRFMPEHMLTT